MGKSAATPPPAPDPTVVSAAQTASNQATADYQSQLNNMNYQGPQGSVTYSQYPGQAQWQEQVNLSPGQQGLYNSEVAGEQGALNLANRQLPAIGAALNNTVTPGALTGEPGFAEAQHNFNPGGAIQASVGPSNYGADLAGEVGTQFGAQMQLLNPQLQQQSEQQQAQLTAQGLNPNDAAYQNAMTLLGNQQATQLSQTAANAVGLGNSEQQALFNEQLGAGNFANQAQNQQYGQNQGQAAFYNTSAQQDFQNKLAESQLDNAVQGQNFQQQSYLQSLPINQFDALMSSGQVSMPAGATYTPTSVAPTNVMDAYAMNTQANEANYQAQMQNKQSGLGGLFNLGSALISLGG